MMRPLLVGLHNPLSTNPRDALWPYPSSGTGGRVLGMMILADPAYTFDDYVADFDRTNLWRGQSLPRGRGATTAYRDESTHVLRSAEGRDDVVLFGARVWDAVTRHELVDWFDYVVAGTTRFWRLPHPSGRNIVYNDHAHRLHAGRILLQVAGR